MSDTLMQAPVPVASGAGPAPPPRPHPDAVAVDLTGAYLTLLLSWNDATGQPVDQQPIQVPLPRLDRAGTLEVLAQVLSALSAQRAQVGDTRPVSRDETVPSEGPPLVSEAGRNGARP